MEAAIEECKNKYDFQVTWLPFLLKPNMPEEGVEKPASYGPNSSGAQRLRRVGQDVGIDFSYKSTRFPNTLPAHCALEFALLQDPSGRKQNELQEVLFKAYFTDGEHLSFDDISHVATSVGLDGNEVKSYISQPSNIQRVKQQAIDSSRSTGVTGVPAFIMNGVMTFSGAQDSEQFKQMFDTVVNKIGSAAL